MPFNKLFIPKIKMNEVITPEYYIEDSSIVVGNLDITADTVSGFNYTSYLSLGSNKRAYGTYYIRFRTPETWDTVHYECILHAEYWITLELDTSHNLYSYSWQANSAQTVIAAANMQLDTDYWMKIEIVGATRNFYVSMDGEEYTLVKTFSDSSAGIGRDSVFFLGQRSNTSSSTDASFSGKIYLNDFKVETAYEVKNISQAGFLTVTQDSVSGFSDANYLIPFDYPSEATNNFEMVWVVNMTDVTSAGNKGVYDSSNGGNGPNMRLTIDSNKVRLRLRSDAANTDNYLFDIIGTTTLSTGVDYYIKVTWDSSNGYSLYLSTDGDTWNLEGSNSNTTKIMAGKPLFVGDNAASGLYLTGSLLLPECYIKVDGTKVWQGSIGKDEYSYSIGMRYVRHYDVKEYTPKIKWGDIQTLTGYELESNKENTVPLYYSVYQANIYTVGTLKVDKDTVYDFSDSNYLKPIWDFLANKQNFEMVFVIKPGSLSSSTYYGIYDTENTRAGCNIRFRIYNNKLELRLRHASSSNSYLFTITGTTTLEANVKYYTKVTYDENEGYAMYLSLDGENWNLEGVNSTLTKVASGNAIRIGDNGDSGGAFSGKMYLNECYIKSNNWMQWQGKIAGNNPAVTIYGYNLKIDGVGATTGFNTMSWYDLGALARYDGIHYLHFKTPKEFHRDECVIHANYWVTIITNDTGMVRYYDWGTSLDHYFAHFQPDTEYWMKLEIGRSHRTFYLSEDGEDYEVVADYTDTGANRTSYSTFYIGQQSSTDPRTVDDSFNGVFYMGDYRMEHEFVLGDDSLQFVGTPTLYHDELSGFSATDYGKALSSFAASTVNSFEINLKINATQWATSYYKYPRIINGQLTGYGDSTTGCTVSVDSSSGSIGLAFFNGSSYTSCTAMPSGDLNTDYWLKWVYDGSTITGSYSTDGVNYTVNQTMTPAFTPRFSAEYHTLGVREHLNSYDYETIFPGTIYLEDTSIKVNGQDYWHYETSEPEMREVLNVSVNPIYDVRKKDGLFGEQGLISSTNHVIGHFTLNDFGEMNLHKIVSESAVASYEIATKIKINSLTLRGILFCPVNYQTGFLIEAGSTNGIRLMWCTNNSYPYNTSYCQYIYAMNSTGTREGVEYWLKWTYDGTNIKGMWSYDGETYSTYQTVAMSKTPRFTHPTYYIGKDNISYNNNGNYVFNGLVDLNESYVKVNDEVIWTGVDIEQLPTKRVREYIAVIVPPESEEE